MKRIKTAEFILLERSVHAQSQTQPDLGMYSGGNPPTPAPDAQYPPTQIPPGSHELAQQENALLQEYHGELRRLETEGMSPEEAREHLHKMIKTEPALSPLREVVQKERAKQKDQFQNRGKQ